MYIAGGLCAFAAFVKRFIRDRQDRGRKCAHVLCSMFLCICKNLSAVGKGFDERFF